MWVNGVPQVWHGAAVGWVNRSGLFVKLTRQTAAVVETITHFGGGAGPDLDGRARRVRVGTAEATVIALRADRESGGAGGRGWHRRRPPVVDRSPNTLSMK